MHFDASPDLLRQLNNKLRSDPRVIRWTALKLGDRLENVIEHKPMTVSKISGGLNDVLSDISTRSSYTPRRPTFASDGETYSRPPYQ